MEQPIVPEIPEIIKTIEEETLDSIRLQEDYEEQKVYYGEEFWSMINYIDSSSTTLNKKVRQTFLYHENGGGNGMTLEII